MTEPVTVDTIRDVARDLDPDSTTPKGTWRRIHQGDDGYIDGFVCGSLNSRIVGIRNGPVADDGTAYFIVAELTKRTVTRRPEHGVRRSTEKDTEIRIDVNRFWIDAGVEVENTIEFRKAVGDQKDYCQELGDENYESIARGTKGGYRTTPLSEILETVGEYVEH